MREIARGDICFGVIPGGRVGEAVLRATGGAVPRAAGEVLHLTVTHDGACPYLDGSGECECSPEATIEDWYRPNGSAA